MTGHPRLSTWAGMLGPVLFVLVFTIEGWLRLGYNPLSTYVSELSLGPRGWIQIANFMLFGLLFFIFARSVAYTFKREHITSRGPMLLTILAVAYFFSGPFVTDPGFIFIYQKSLHGILHGLFGAAVFLLMPISCFVFFRSFRTSVKWRSFSGWTLAAGILISAAVILLTIATKLPVPQGVFSDWVGLIQRTAIIPYMLWLFVFAYTLR